MNHKMPTIFDNYTLELTAILAHPPINQVTILYVGYGLRNETNKKCASNMRSKAELLFWNFVASKLDGHYKVKLPIKLAG